MPTVLYKNGFRFYFYSLEHEPIHVHIEGKGGYAKYDLENMKLISNNGIKSNDLSKAINIAESEKGRITAEWNERFN